MIFESFQQYLEKVQEDVAVRGEVVGVGDVTVDDLVNGLVGKCKREQDNVLLKLKNKNNGRLI